MGLGDRISQWIEERRAEWGDALGTFLLDRLAGGMTKSLEDMEPGAIEGYQLGLQKLVDDPNVPEDLRAFYKKALGTGNWISAIGGMLTMVLQSFGVLLGGSQPLSNIFRYEQDKQLETFRLDPLNIITAWRRNPALGEAFFEDLREQGWSQPRIDLLKLVTQFLPSPDEQTFWLAREVFEPKMVEKYGLDDELPVYANTEFSKVGVTPEQMINKWRAHWEHASFIQMVEMLHRGLITEKDLFEWYRLVEIVPFWRDKLTQIAYTWPTRVDVRRWWDMRTITEERLRELYSGMGYRGENLDDYVLWTKVYVAFPDLLARWSNGWISINDVRSELVKLGMPAERVEEFIEAKIKAPGAERTSSDRQITITDIYKGIRLERITREEGVELLQELGFDEDEALYKISVNVPEDTVETVVKDRQLTKSDIFAGLKAEVLTVDEARARLLEKRYSAVDTQLLLDIYLAGARELAKADIVKAFKAGAIEEAEALTRLQGRGYTEEDARILLFEKEEPPVEARKRQASKADIVLGVKKGLITSEEGYLMLLDIGFSPEASQFILTVKVESSPFSPVTFGEFKDLTGKWRRAAGMTSPAFNERLRKAGDELVQISTQVKTLQDELRREELLQVDQDVIPEDAEKRIKELTVAKNRAVSEKERIQSAYNALVAEFRQTESG